MTPNDAHKADTQLRDSNVRRTVGLSALKKIRRLVDEHEEEQAFARRLSRKLVVFVLVGLVAFIGITLGVIFWSPPAEQAVLDRLSNDQSSERRRFAGSKTTDPVTARYVTEWRQKMEELGTTEFPQLIKEKHLYGTVAFTAAIRSDGTLESIELNRPSAFRELNTAVQALVRRAAPFAPFPSELKQAVDVLHITNVFVFARGDSTTSPAQQLPSSSNRPMQPTAKGGG